MDHARLIDPFPPESAVAIRSQRVTQFHFQSVIRYATKHRLDFRGRLLQMTLESVEWHSGKFSADFKISERAVSNHIVFQASERGDGTPSKNPIINSRYLRH